MSGNETLFRFASGEATDLAVGDEARFSFDPARAHLF